MDKHKFEKNKKYYTISMYVLITFIVAIIAFKLIWNWGSTLRTVHKILDVLSPFLIGIFIAYLMNPLVKLIDGKLLKKIFRIKSDKIRKFISILFSYVIVLGIIGVCISIIVPEIYSSLKNIYDGVQGSYDKLVNFLDKTSKEHPTWDIEDTVIEAVWDSENTKLIKSALLPVEKATNDSCRLVFASI